ncbi:AraC family transcriptional regulator [bacterium SCSIO 12643]|nr:AraC family transcriptional regulator [bacterium SCSIO 12643]
MAVTICLFLGLHYCFLYTQNRLSNILLGFIFIALGFSIASEALEYYFDHPVYDIVALIFNSPLLFVTILLYYASTVTQTWKTNWPIHKRFLLLVLADILLAFILFIFQIEPHPILFGLYFTVIGAINLYMLYLILKQIDLHNKHIRNLFSSIENKQLNWLRLLAVINMGFIVFWWMDDTLAALIGDNLLSGIISELSIYFTVINVIWMGYASLRQPVIFETEPEVFFTEEPAKETQQPSSDDRATFKRIQKQIENQQLYTHPTLSLKSLADTLEMRDRELSRIINQCYGHNFYHFINAYRVAHFKEAFSNGQNQHLSIMGLATEAGFKSKSTFYAAFKKMEGITPREFAEKT